MIETFWVSAYRNWIWLGVPVMLAAAAALGLSIARVIAVMKKAHLFKVPFAASQAIEFLEAGRVILSVEGPRFTMRFAGVGFVIQDPGGAIIESHPALFRATTSGVTTVRMELRKFNIPMPGRYVLNMTGLGEPREGDDRHSVVFMKPHLRHTMVSVLSIVLSSVVLILSLVFFLMRVAGVE
jgi:hypothetical protein